MSTYKYSSTTSNNYNINQGGYPGEEAPLLPRPFPTPSPTPEQQPPKKLDDLMATFSDGQGTEIRVRDLNLLNYYQIFIEEFEFDFKLSEK